MKLNSFDQMSNCQCLDANLSFHLMVDVLFALFMWSRNIYIVLLAVFYFLS